MNQLIGAKIMIKKITTQNIKEALDINFVFKFVIVTVTLFISFFSLNKSIEGNLLLGRNSYSVLLLSMFIFFSFELSRKSLREEKISGRIELYLANGVPLNKIIVSYSISTFITTNILLIVAILYSFISIGINNFEIINYFICALINSFLLNCIILAIKNMNLYKYISLIIFLFNIISILLEYYLYIIFKIKIYVFKIVFLLIMTLFIYKKIKIENVVNSYY